MRSARPLALFAAVILAAGIFGCTRKVPAGIDVKAAEQKLEAVRASVQNMLNTADQIVAGVSEKLSTTGLSGPEARAILADLCKNADVAVACGAIDANGTLVTIVPEQYADREGADLSAQPMMLQMLRDHKPFLNDILRTEEGNPIVDLAWPVYDQKGVFIGSVGALFQPAPLIKKFIYGDTDPSTLDAWVMETGGLILFDPNDEEIGRNLFTDPLYQPFKDLQTIGKQISKDAAGDGTYTFTSTTTGKVVNKRCFWATATLHGTDWRIVLIYDNPKGS